MFLLELKFERQKQIRLLIEQDFENKLTRRKYLLWYTVKFGRVCDVCLFRVWLEKHSIEFNSY